MKRSVVLNALAALVWLGTLTLNCFSLASYYANGQTTQVVSYAVLVLINVFLVVLYGVLALLSYLSKK